MEDLECLVDRVRTRHDLVKFIGALRRDLESNPDGWENGHDLNSYLDALQAWVDEADGYFENPDRPFSEEQAWQLAAMILCAPKFYE